MDCGTASSGRWWVLIVVSTAQLVVLLDTMIVNIVLPDAQSDLHLPDAGRQWIVTAYALALGRCCSSVAA